MCARRFEKQTNVTVRYDSWQCGTKDAETKKVLRLVQMSIDKDPGNRLLNRSKTILIRILSVTLVLLLLLFPQLRSTILNIYSIEFAKLYVQFIIPRRD